jgi:hypothetical protein
VSMRSFRLRATQYTWPRGPRLNPDAPRGRGAGDCTSSELKTTTPREGADPEPLRDDAVGAVPKGQQ